MNSDMLARVGFGGLYFWCRIIIFEYLKRVFIFRVSIGIEPDGHQGYTIGFGCIGIKFFGRDISLNKNDRSREYRLSGDILIENKIKLLEKEI